jgi:hypothetical protein
VGSTALVRNGCLGTGYSRCRPNCSPERPAKNSVAVGSTYFYVDSRRSTEVEVSEAAAVGPVTRRVEIMRRTGAKRARQPSSVGRPSFRGGTGVDSTQLCGGPNQMMKTLMGKVILHPRLILCMLHTFVDPPHFLHF